MSLQSTDQIADLITRIRNAIMVGKTDVTAPTSKLKVAVCESLKKAGYILDYIVYDGEPRGTLRVIICEKGKNPTINEIVKVSKPGRRVYTGVDDIPKVKSGRGIVLLSTPKGIMTGAEARKARLGGEILVKVY